MGKASIRTFIAKRITKNISRMANSCTGTTTTTMCQRGQLAEENLDWVTGAYQLVKRGLAARLTPVETVSGTVRGTLPTKSRLRSSTRTLLTVRKAGLSRATA